MPRGNFNPFGSNSAEQLAWTKQQPATASPQMRTCLGVARQWTLSAKSGSRPGQAPMLESYVLGVAHHA
jgi:hypothetical protein